MPIISPQVVNKLPLKLRTS